MLRRVAVALAMMAAACASPEPGAVAGNDAHAELACAACHQGPRGERGRASVPSSSCTAAGCHGDGGPAEVRVATVTFPHRDHAPDGRVEPTCAGCHTHGEGDEALHASVDACALCHVAEVGGGDVNECRLCHQKPDHSRLTSQGVAVSHSALPHLEVGCVRCHYDVADPPTTVAAGECRQCHEDLESLNAAAVGRDLHPIHDGLTCTSCHESGTHHVRAMSSAVQLVCSDCHRQAHEVDVEPDGWAATSVCSDCHGTVHQPQQQLLLGVSPSGEVLPSEKFLAGITCRSCHIPPSGAAASVDRATPIRGQAAACAGCHESEYATVLDWWLEGSRDRLASASAYLEAANRALAGVEAADRDLELAAGMVGLVARAGGQHNLELSDRLLRQSVERVQSAYRSAGRAPPPRPDMGRVPHSGLCSYCHYSPSEPWDFEAMSERFHETVLSPPR